MALITAGSDATRRHALLIGTSSYRPGWADIADGVKHELGRLSGLLTTTLRYDSCLTLLDKSRDDLAEGVLDWIQSPSIAEDDLALVYYTGHAVAQGSHLRLITPATRADAVNTAPSASDLANWVWGTAEGPRCRHVLLIIDTCNSGAGGLDALRIATEIREAAGGKARGGGFHVIAAARSIETAAPRRFADALCDVIDSGVAGTPADEWLRPDAIVDRVNATPEFRDASQHADITERGEGYFRFFPNPLWDPKLRASMDSAQRQRALRRVQELAVRTHWNPKRRGVAVDTERGSFFVGRTRALQDLGAWATSAPAGAGRVVVGRPGSGKSALLARFADGAATGVPAAAVDLAIHARAKSWDAVLLELAFGLGIDIAPDTSDDGLLRAVLDGLKKRGGRTVVVIDALDESELPDTVAVALRYLVEGALPIALIVGVRRGDAQSRTVSRLGPRFVPLDVDAAPYWNPQDAVDYVGNYLAQAGSSPYRGGEHAALRAEIAGAVAQRAGTSFLIASATAHTLVRRPDRISRQDLDSLPATAGEAFDQDLRRFPAVERRDAVAVMSALAFAEGRGLPRALLQVVASALAGTPLAEPDITDWLKAVDFYIVSDRQGGTEAFRLYHDEFARYLRDKQMSGGLADVAVTQALAGTAGDEPAGWLTADPYVQQYFCVHAAKSKIIDRYLLNPGFLAASDPGRLLDTLKRLPRSAGDVPDRVYRVVRLAYHQIRDQPQPAARASQLQLAARERHEDALADRFAATLNLPWDTIWAELPVDSSLTLCRFGSMIDVDAIAAAMVDGEQVIAAAEHRVVRLWDFTTGIERQPTLTQEWGLIQSVAAIDLDGTPVLISGDSEGVVNCWDLRSGAIVKTVSFGSLGSVTVAAGYATKEPIVVASQSGLLLVWRLRDGSVVRDAADAPRGARICSIAIADHRGHGVVLAGRADGTVEVLDPATLKPSGEPLRGHSGRVASIVTTEIDGAAVIATASLTSNDPTMRVWDLDTRHERHDGVVPDPFGTRALAALRLEDGTPCVATGASDLAVWNAHDGALIGRLHGHEGPVRSLLVVSAGEDIELVTGGVDGTIRRWDLRDCDASLPEPDPYSAFSAVTAGSIGADHVLVSAQGLGHLQVRDMATGRIKSQLPVVYPDWLYKLRIADIAGVRTLVFSSEDTSIRRMRLDSLELTDPLMAGALRVKDDVRRPLRSFALIERSTGTAAICVSGHEPVVREVALTGRSGPAQLCRLKAPAADVAISRDGVAVTMVLLEPDEVLVFDAAAEDHTVALLRSFPTPVANLSAIAAVVRAPDVWVFTGGWNRAVSLIDGAGQVLASLALDTVVNDLFVDPSGMLIVAGNKGLVAVRCNALPAGSLTRRQVNAPLTT